MANFLNGCVPVILRFPQVFIILLNLLNHEKKMYDLYSTKVTILNLEMGIKDRGKCIVVLEQERKTREFLAPAKIS